MSDITPHIGEIEQILKKAAIDGALTEEAINIFHSTLQENEALKETKRKLTADNVKLEERCTQMTQQYDDVHSKLAEANARESELKDREKKVTELEIRKECADQRVADHQEMFRVVFRNAVVRKEVMTPVEGHPGDQYNAGSGGYAHKDTTEEEET